MIQVCKQEAMPFHHFKCFVRGADERFETLKRMVQCNSISNKGYFRPAEILFF